MCSDNPKQWSKWLPLVECNVVFMVQLESDMLTRIKASWQSDLDVQKLISKLQSDSNWVRGELRRKRRLVIGKDLELRKDILKWLHSSACGGHSGRDATLQRVKAVSSLLERNIQGG